jgi:UDP-N-acetylmuramate dehydrogenase
MKIKENILLKNFTTLRIGGEARYFAVAKNEDDLRELFAFAKGRKLPIFILGGGSNLLVSDHGFHGLIIKNEIKGIKFTDQVDNKVILEVGAGEILDDVIILSVLRKLSNLENLSGIPGTVGGAAVQNAGAYGVELADCIISVEGLRLENGKKFVFKKGDCQYGYRDSLFKKNKKYIITNLTLELNKNQAFKLDYAGLKNLLKGRREINVEEVRQAVLQIRAEKLPDWHKLGTAGSFFKNPVILSEKFKELKENYPDLPGFVEPKGKTKISLAWILDNICHLKGYRVKDAGLYDKQPIVLVNYGASTSLEIISFTDEIKKIVNEKIGIEIEEEVEKII